jgi:hypothetical protein
MTSSEEALPFFNDWMNNKTKLGVNAVGPNNFTASGSGIIASLDSGTVWVWDTPSGFSMYIPLEGAVFTKYDPERGSGDPTFDSTMREVGFRFVWQVALPDGTVVVFSDLDMDTPSDMI